MAMTQRRQAAPSDARRSLPAVHAVLAEAALADLLEAPPATRRAAAQAALERAREGVRQGRAVPTSAELAAEARASVVRMREPPLRPVVNATGVPLHTNLGRSVLAVAAVRAVVEAAERYSNLEYDLEAGARGSRTSLVEPLLLEVTGGEAALVVNNNAAAVFLCLKTLAEGREVVVSRGELVEIGDGFRVPDVMRESGARLVEVGTTNRTHRQDYERAIGPETAMLFKAHPSNFRIRGFAAEVDAPTLAALAHSHGLPAVMDLGSGLLAPLSAAAGGAEPVVGELLGAGLDAVMFSGDKLVGGPQCGIVVGRRTVVERLRRHPLARALRVDKMTLAALAATLALYRDGRADEVPTIAMLAATPADLRRRAVALARRLGQALGDRAEVATMAGASRAGGGSLPDLDLPTWLVSVAPQAHGVAALAARLRQGSPAVVARIEDDRLLLDPRTLLPGDARILEERLRAALLPKDTERER
jgi:L-seryl-tRNA(Ser) seleniumtransferase